MSEMDLEPLEQRPSLKYHPTCHKVSLTATAKLVAFFDMAFGLFGLVWFVLMLARYSIISLDPFENIETVEQKRMEYSASEKLDFALNHKVINLSLVAFYTGVNLSVFVLLLVGIYKKSPGICLIWFHIRCAIFVFKLIILIMYIIGGRPIFSQLPFIISMLAHLYGLWVVNCYAEELKVGKFEKRVKEAKERNNEAIQENRDEDDIPNGIEAIQKRRLEAGLENSKPFGK